MKGLRSNGGQGSCQEDNTANEYMCVGDHVCLFSQHAPGYVFSELST